MALILDDSVLLSGSYIVVRPVTSLCLMFFAYGIYIPVFIVAIRLLMHPRQGNDKAYLCSTLVLFLLATAITILQTQLVVREALINFAAVKTRDTSSFEQYQVDDRLSGAVSSASFYITNIANMVADCILIHRCYTIWQNKKQIAIPFLIAVFTVSVMGFTSMIMITVGSENLKNLRIARQGMTLQTVYFALDAAVNFIITLLTAFKIWSISREVGKLMGRAGNMMHQVVIAIILESGVLYPATIVLHIALRSSIPHIGMPVNLYPIITIVAGIAPTLIIVRGKLTATENQPRFSTFKFVDINNSGSDQATASTASPSPTDSHRCRADN
ncbi:hypothetical protein L218DRAFT_987124 [Marasmius fiardii PR-910]|nr:hypothetical protein L218DRAFT_987124 [Marasmius fiardii PR-910]